MGTVTLPINNKIERQAPMFPFNLWFFPILPWLVAIRPAVAPQPVVDASEADAPEAVEQNSESPPAAAEIIPFSVEVNTPESVERDSESPPVVAEIIPFPVPRRA
jgi:hypothetical protein